MPVILNTTTVAANAVNANIITGSAYEFARGPQVVSMGITQAATGLFVIIQSGSDVIAEEFEPPILTRYSIIPDEMYFTDVMAMGDRLVIRVRNSTGAGIIVRAVVAISTVQ